MPFFEIKPFHWTPVREPVLGNKCVRSFDSADCEDCCSIAWDHVIALANCLTKVRDLLSSASNQSRICWIRSSHELSHVLLEIVGHDCGRKVSELAPANRDH